LNAAGNDSKSIADKDCPSLDKKRGKDRHDAFDIKTVENRFKVDVFKLRILFVGTVELEFCRIVERDLKDLSGIWELAVVDIVEHRLDVLDGGSTQKVDDLFEHIGVKMVTWTIEANKQRFQ